MDEDALKYLADASEGDARRALTALEIAVLSCSEKTPNVTLAAAVESLGAGLEVMMPPVMIYDLSML